ncbi:NAD-dependent protein deacetylase sirtuin-2 [Acipenser ruthenus]|uniref:NAD-dependent protein deacetylase sirtuin-2 n=1 Tax=Acipenser ruthenus TaxID=7906 RepID=A0A662YPC1_ACIRT|nr:NAD-dependent protein deacetylase sirtuin-2 [Acipenser ruthenus]
MQGLGSGPVEQVLDELSLEGMARYMQSGDCKNVICMVGAGISTCNNLQKYDLPCPEAIFEIGYFKQHPEPFFTLARELYPGQFKPTVCHYFMCMLKEKGLLRRCYTQNIDTLERVAGLQEEDLIEAHGTFHTSHCLNFLCREEYGLPWMKDIVFFGESLPARFSSSLRSDELVAMVTRQHAAIDALEGGGASASMANKSSGAGDKGEGPEQKDKPADQSGAGERGKED